MGIQGQDADVKPGEQPPVHDDAAIRPAEPARAAASPSMLSPTGFSNHAIHLVRTSQQINLSLSQMADQKASILMGATFLVFTLSVGQAKNGTLPYALAILALFAFASALCAVFAVLPSISGPKKGVGSTNKLFFGYFTAMDEKVWTDSIIAELRADETVFRTMLHDIYQNGQVLQRKKFKYLGLAYRIFITGMCLTVVAFIAENLAAGRF
jgi:hypothetical protein